MDYRWILLEAAFMTISLLQFFTTSVHGNVQYNVINEPLHCYNCYGSATSEDCQNLEDWNQTQCDEDEGYCVVERMETDGALTTFARECSTNCTPGCKTVGTLYRITHCYSCCQYNLCNRDNAGDSLSGTNAIVKALLLCFLCLVLLRRS